MTFAEWAALPEDEPGELVDGRLEDEEGADYVHELIVSWLNALFRSWLAGRGYAAFGVRFYWVVDPELETVVINTGHGLKTLDAVTDLVGPAATIAPTYDAFVAAGIA